MHMAKGFVCFAALLVLAAGCAFVPGEKAALETWRREQARLPGRELAAEKDDVGVVPPDLTERSTLEDCVRYGLLNNPGLRAAFDRWKATLEKVEPARTLPDPLLTYGYFIEQVETRVGPQRQKIGVMQMFPWLGKLDLRGRMALEEANAAQQQYEAAKRALIHKIKTAYCEYWYLDQAIRVTQENVELLAYLENVALTRYAAGAGEYGSVIKAQVEMGKLDDRLASLRDLERPVLAQLNASLNRPPDAPMPGARALPEEEFEISRERLLEDLRKSNPSLKALDFMASKEELAIELARKNFFPDVSLGVDYIDTHGSRPNGMMPNPPDSGKDPVVAMISINLPVWHRKYRAIRREAEARRRAAAEERENLENELTSELEMALYELRDAERKIALYRDTLAPKAEQSLNVAQQAFAVDKVDFLDLIDAQRMLLEFQLAVERARADRAQRLAQIEKLTGGDALAP
ncbi:MAG TPA: TolC family protein [Sumerlaeia bacterium]|nr:TolC family protein [Sumerlaeia bacterium]